MSDERDDLERVQEIFDFLQGTMPASVRIKDKAEIPNLTADQAWIVIWFLGNEYYQVPDKIERCNVCGDLYNTESGGGHDEEGPPYNFCEDCDSERTGRLDRRDDF